jgi:hypothetical protein
VPAPAPCSMETQRPRKETSSAGVNHLKSHEHKTLTKG